MKTKNLVIGAIAAATVFAGGWALAQSVGSDDFGPPFMRGKGPDGMGHGMMKGMRQGMGPGMMGGMEHNIGAGIMSGMGPRMMHGASGQTFADPARIEACPGAGLDEICQDSSERRSHHEDSARKRRS